MTTKVPVILVGAGQQGSVHAAAWGKAGGVLKAVVDTNIERRESLCHSFRVPSQYSSLEEALGSGLKGIVDIVAPPEVHKELILTALSKGASVLVEKPFVMTPAEAVEVVDAAKTAGASVCVMHTMRFSPIVRKMVEMVEEGTLGEIISVGVSLVGSVRNDYMINNPQHWSHKLPGGRLEEGLPHVVYLLSTFLGTALEIVEVIPSKRTNLDWVAFDTISGMVKGTAPGTFLITSASGKESITIDVVGSKGIAQAHLMEGFLETSYPSITHGTRNSLERVRSVVGQIGTRGFSLAENGIKVLTGRWESGNQYIMGQFVRSLRQGFEPPVSLEEAETTVRLTHAIISRYSSTSPLP